ncbi:uncharacterized protein LOC121863282 [Homarus americanus]|uniref:uncharacterized protein LOC121863282 n=1 Tax=Homarus americanus TaxID=6706 RepID=UPI001C46B4B0|nr:uncharacterized protein LOC121863282 [Homarus americanus]
MSEGRNFIQCGKNLKCQSIASVESQNRTLIQSKEQDLHIFSDPKKLNIPGAIVGPPPTVGLDESSVIVSKSSGTLGNQSEHRDCSALANNSESVISSIIDRQTVNINDNIMDITVSSSTTIDRIETEKSEHKSSSLSSEPNTQGEHDKRTEQMKNSDTSTAQTILNSISKNGYHIQEEEGQLDSSHSYSLSLEQINNTDNPTQNLFKSDSGGEKLDNEVCELNALELKKMQLVKKVKMLVTQKNNLNLQRDTVMNNFSGDTAKLAHILKENSHLSNRISSHILKINAEIKFTNKKICDLENSRSREKPSLLKDSCMDKKKTNASSHSALLSSKLETEPTVNLSNYHSLHKHETKDISKGQESHVSMQKKSTSKVKDSEIHTKPNEICSQTDSRMPVMTQKRKVFQEEEGDNTEMCDESLRQTQHAYSARDNSTARKDSYQENIKATKTKGATSESSNTLKKNLCPENDKSVVLKSYMSDISKDMNTYWCKPCNVFFINVYGYVKHLESSSHLEKLKDDDCSWMEKLPNYKMDQQQEDINENQHTLGVEYLHS